MAKGISPKALKARIGAVGDGTELAILDVREEGVYARGHPLFASSCPLSRLELLIRDLVPRRGAPVVVMDDGDGLAERAAEKLSLFGYGDVGVLAGGLKAWRDGGFEVFSGVNVPSKAFGELVEQCRHTPHIDAHRLKIMMDRGDDLVVLDSRPLDEYRLMSIPGAIDCPVSELLYRLHDLAPDPDTRIVVNCAGRTRSILGAQSLINAGVPHDVVALENGTMGWHLAGYALERNAGRTAPDISPAGLDFAAARADAVARAAGVEVIDFETFERFRGESDARSLYVFDIRLEDEYARAHLAGARHCLGVQLVQKTDSVMATLGARVVVVDDTGVRARMTAAWLRQMGWAAYVLAGGFAAGPTASGRRQPEVPGLDDAVAETIAPRMAMVQAQRRRAQIIDLSRGPAFIRGHIPGARFAIRSRFAQSLPRVTAGELILTSEDGMLARLAAGEAAAAGRPVRVLAGGNAAWRHARLPMESGPGDPLDALDDEAFFRPYDRSDNQESEMSRYLSWEQGLTGQVARDGTARFKVVGA